jgi:hypothetical protein
MIEIAIKIIETAFIPKYLNAINYQLYCLLLI